MFVIDDYYFSKFKNHQISRRPTRINDEVPNELLFFVSRRIGRENVPLSAQRTKILESTAASV